MMSQEQWQKVKNLAMRYPSPHNVQPFSFCLKDNVVSIVEMPGRRLREGDPEGRDHLVTFGCALELLSIALSGCGFFVDNRAVPINEDEILLPRSSELRTLLRLPLLSGVLEDALFPEIMRRRCFRGVFTKAPTSLSNDLRDFADRSESYFIDDLEKKSEFSFLHDKLTQRLMRRSSFTEELYQWLRFTRAHPMYNQDGLNAECMSLSSLEARLGQFFMKPSIFKILASLGLEKSLVAEHSKTQSAMGLFVLTHHDHESWIAAGQRLMRVWLGLSAYQIYGWPMSSLYDDPLGQSKLREYLNLGVEQSILMVLRVGYLPQLPPLSPRIDWD